MMSIRLILNTRENTFRLFGDNSCNFCDVTVKIDHHKYIDDTEYYNITYTYTYSDESDESRSCNPLYDKPNHMDGETLVVNELSTTLCKYLLTPLDELSNYTGNVTAQYYKGSIMNMISYLGD